MEYQVGNIFIEKSCRKCAEKASPRPNEKGSPRPKLIQNSHCMQELISKARYFERGLSKSLLKKVAFFLLSSPVPFNRQNYHKTKGACN